MPTTPRVSILVPSYNYAGYLDETITAVLQQSFVDLELIVCDDGSKDESAAILRARAKNDERIVALYQDNQGICATLNTLATHARGEFIIALGCDDVLEPDRIERGIAELDSHPECVGVFCDVSVIDSVGAPSQALKFPRIAGYDARMLALRLLGGNCFCASSGILRREAVWKTGPLARNFLQTQDYELWLRLARIGALRYQDFAGVRYRWHGNNMSGKNAWLCAWEERRHLNEHGQAIVEQHGLGQEGIERMLDRQVGLSVQLEDHQTVARIFLKKLQRNAEITERQLVWLIRYAFLHKMGAQAQHLLKLAEREARSFGAETNALLKEVQLAMQSC